MKRTPLSRTTPLVRLPRPRVGMQPTKKPKAKPGEKRVKLRSGGVPENSAFLEFIRLLPCILLGNTDHTCGGKVEAAHIGTGAGVGQKAPDETAVPMCGRAHRTERYAHHRIPKSFFRHWGLDRDELIARFQKLFQNKRLTNVSPSGIIDRDDTNSDELD